MKDCDWDIRLSGRAWTSDEAFARHALVAHTCRIEMSLGRLLWDDEERLVLLALLLENVGALRAVKLGDPRVWQDAVRALDGGTT